MSPEWISPKAKIGSKVQIGLGTHILPNVEIGEGTVIGDHCVIGHPAGGEFKDQKIKIGPNSIIRSHSVLYEGSAFGPKLETGHHALIREGTRAGINLRVGSFSDIEGDTQFGNYCRLHSYVHVGRGSQIGDFVWLYSLNTLTNDPLPPSHLSRPIIIEEGAVVCVNAYLMPGVHIQRGAYIASGAYVNGTVPPGAVVTGTDGRIVSHVTHLADNESGISHPWMDHFSDAYPAEAHSALEALRAKIVADKSKFLEALRAGK